MTSNWQGSPRLLPCPFCGTEPHWAHHGSSISYTLNDGIQRVWMWQSSIHCGGCKIPHCSGFGDVVQHGGNGTAHRAAMDNAALQWNQRYDNTQD